MANVLAQPAFSWKGQDKDRLAKEISLAIWGLEIEAPNFDARKYLHLYANKLTQVHQAYFKPTQHQHVVDLVDVIRAKTDTTLSELQAELRGASPTWLGNGDDEAALWCLRFGASVWLMSSYEFSERWELDQSLRGYVTSELECPAKNVDVDFQPTEEDLRRIGDFRIEFTDNIEEHLQFTETGRQLQVFRHHEYLDRPGRSVHPEVAWWSNILEETAGTMLLLFPGTTDPARHWWYRVRGNVYVDIEMQPYYKENRIGKYKYWRDRLSTIQEQYAKAKPRTLKQFWYDRRDKSMWYSIWLAIIAIGLMTLIFGIISSVTGIMQVVKSG